MIGLAPPSRPRARHGARFATRGMTLFEVLIVVVLIALFSSAVLFGSGMLSSNRMNAAAILIVSATRLGMTRTNAAPWRRPVRRHLLDAHLLRRDSRPC